MENATGNNWMKWLKYANLAFKKECLHHYKEIVWHNMYEHGHISLCKIKDKIHFKKLILFILE